jgi:hypothetical protein
MSSQLEKPYRSDTAFEDWGVWWLLLGYSHAADLLNPISDLR